MKDVFVTKIVPLDCLKEEEDDFGMGMEGWTIALHMTLGDCERCVYIDY